MTAAMTEEELRVALAASQTRAKEAEENMMKAASLGKNLLEEKAELQEALEKAMQERHEAVLRADSKDGILKALQEEVDALRAELRHSDAAHERVRTLEKDLETQASVRDGLLDRVRAVEAELEEAERRVTSAEAARRSPLPLEKSVCASEEMLQQLYLLQSEKAEWEQEKQRLTSEADMYKDLADEWEAKTRLAELKIREVEATVEEKECEITAYCKSLDSARQEVLDAQAEMDALRFAGLADPSHSKGNSIFSEVEDRRHKVESQMTLLKNKYEDAKIKLDAAMMNLQKVKMQNVALLNLNSTGRTDTDQVRRLEELLDTERTKNKRLIEAMNTASSNIDQCSESLEEGAQRNQYSYLTTMLSESKSKNKELQDLLQQQIRQNLEDSDNVIELSRKVNTLESSLSKARAENYQLNVKIEELRQSKAGETTLPQPKPRERRTIFENIKFENGKTSEPPRANKKDVETNPMDPLSSSAKENAAPLFLDGGEPVKRKRVCISTSCESVDEEGVVETNVTVNFEENAKKPKKSANKKESKVIIADEEVAKQNEQCTTQ